MEMIVTFLLPLRHIGQRLCCAYAKVLSHASNKNIAIQMEFTQFTFSFQGTTIFPSIKWNLPFEKQKSYIESNSQQYKRRLEISKFYIRCNNRHYIQTICAHYLQIWNIVTVKIQAYCSHYINSLKYNRY